MNRLLSGMMYLMEVHTYWRNGFLISFQENWGLVKVSNFYRRITVSIRTEKSCSVPLLSLISEIIDQMLENWFCRSNVRRLIVCSHCIESLLCDPYFFSLEEIEMALVDHVGFVNCERKGSQPHPIELNQLVPDLIMKDLDYFKIAFEDIEIQEKLADGAYGVLYKGLYKKEIVAIKILRKESSMMEDKLQILKEFRKEVSIMTSTKHRNLVNLKGFCSDPKGSDAMVMEFLSGGDLYSLIKKYKYSTGVALKIAFDIARGMNFLHQLQPPIIHRDLKPPNVLLKEKVELKHSTVSSIVENGEEDIEERQSPQLDQLSRSRNNSDEDVEGKSSLFSNSTIISFENCQSIPQAKVADFGLSTRQYIQEFTERAVETPIWVAPEILKGEFYSTKSDVYSYAIVIFELFTQLEPFYDFEFKFLRQLEEHIISGNRPSLSSIRLEVPEVVELIEECWNDSPKSRPSFQGICERLLEILKVRDNEMYKIVIHELEEEEEERKVEIEKERMRKERYGMSESSRYSAYANKPHLEGAFQKKLRLDPPVPIFSMVLVGKEIWTGQRDGSIAIWSAENGNLLRTISEAHRKEIRSMILVNNRVWSASQDGTIKIWNCPNLSNSERGTLSTKLIAKDGYLLYSEDTSNQKKKVRVLVRQNDILFDGRMFKLQNAKASVIPMALQTVVEKRPMFTLTSPEEEFFFFCENEQECDDWARAINNAVLDNFNLCTGHITCDYNDELNTILSIGNSVYCGGSNDLIIRVYDAITLECKKEHLISETIWVPTTRPTTQKPRGLLQFQRGLSSQSFENSTVCDDSISSFPTTALSSSLSSSSSPPVSPYRDQKENLSSCDNDSEHIHSRNQNRQSLSAEHAPFLPKPVKKEPTANSFRSSFSMSSSPLSPLPSSSAPLKKENRFIWFMCHYSNSLWVAAHQHIFKLDPLVSSIQ